MQLTRPGRALVEIEGGGGKQLGLSITQLNIHAHHWTALEGQLMTVGGQLKSD